MRHQRKRKSIPVRGRGVSGKRVAAVSAGADWACLMIDVYLWVLWPLQWWKQQAGASPSRLTGWAQPRPSPGEHSDCPLHESPDPRLHSHLCPGP